MEILNGNNFDEKIKDGIVVVDFFATWCGPCRMMAPILEEAGEELGEKVKIYKVDVDQEPALARNYGIMSIPTIIVFENGQLREKHIGLWQKDDLVDQVKSYL